MSDADVPTTAPYAGLDGDGGGDDGDAATRSDDGPHSEYVDRIRKLAAEAREARETFDPSASGGETERDGVGDVDADGRAMTYAREGVGPVVALYIEAHTGGRNARFSDEELRLLHRALNDWLTLYARCYGVDLEASFSIREAADLLVQTHNVRDTAQLLTCVPARRS